MKEEVQDWVERSIRDFEKRRSVSKVLSMEQASVVAKGDNYTSELSRLRLKVQLRSGEIEERSVIYKALPSTEMMRRHIAESGLFLIEKRMYTEVLPLLEKIRREKEDGEPLWGECFAATNSEMLLEDLAVLGYKMGDRMKGLDFDHSRLVMKSLAKFHALSAVLKQRGELVVRDYDKHFVQRNAEMMGTFYRSSFEGLARTIETDWRGEWLPFAEKLRKKAETVLDDLIADLSTDGCKFVTLNHGDCWVNNMLFKYDDLGRPVAVRFLDFQVAFLNSVGADLQYFLSTSLRLDTLPMHLELLRIYHEALVSNLMKHGYADEPITYEELKADFLKRTFIGTVMAISVLPFVKMPSSEVPDLEKVVGEYHEAKGATMDPSSFKNSSDGYRESMQAVMRIAAEHGVL